MDEQKTKQPTDDSRQGLQSPHATELRCDDDRQQPTDYLDLTQAAQITPGRPSSNCLWRWARRGVLARNGERVHLRHVRLGGRILTTRRWLDEFGHALATADARFFDQVGSAEQAAQCALAKSPAGAAERGMHVTSNAHQVRAQQLDAIERELDAEGLV